MPFVKTALGALLPSAQKEADGRDLFPNRTAFILAAVGGAVGLGNVLRYPSVVFANSGVQWFIPYLIALFFLGIPVLLLELSLGQAYRAGVVTAFSSLSYRLKGTGLGVCLTGYIVVVYYVPILAWIMQYFRYSFHSPLQWEGRTQEFFDDVVVANVAPIPGVIENGEVVSYSEYTDLSLIGETVGWVAFIWFCVWLSMFAGVSLTGRAVYVTMGLPIVMLIILLGRSASLDNSLRGVRYYFGEWHGSKLGSGDIWQAACGQIFFSIGVGFGYFTTYASYNNRFANAVQDTLIIAFSNSMFEIVAGFVVFSIIGFLDMNPVDDGRDLGTFVVGFLTYPSAIVEIPGANFWGVLWFLTIALLGVSSSVALTETLVTVLNESVLSKRVPRWATATAVIVVSFLLSLMYCTRFGFYLLDAVDSWVNNVTLLEIVWCEIVCVSILYRHKDIVSQVGWIAYVGYSITYGFSQFVGVVVGQSVGPEAGAGAGFGMFVVGTILSVLLAKKPDSIPSPLFKEGSSMSKMPVISSLNSIFQSGLGSKFWWLAFYSTNQIRRDMNLIVAQGANWSIPVIWGPVLRYISAPILAIIASFSYPSFYNEKRMDPLHVFGFVNAHISTLLVVIGLIIPRALDVFVVPARRHDSKVDFVPQEPNPAMMARIDGIDEMEGAERPPVNEEYKP